MKPLLRSLSICVSLVLAFSIPTSADDTDWKCSAEFGGHSYDFTPLGGERVLPSKERDTPPTKMIDELTFDLCKPLPEKHGPESDQCQSGTYACLTTTNYKSGESNRVVHVRPLAASDSLNPTVSQPSNGVVSIVLHGSRWPPSSETEQSFQVTVECSQEEELTWSRLDDGGASVNWKNKAACHSPNDPDSPPQDDETSPNSPSRRGSGVGWFFLILLLAIVGYFGIGAWYNYNNYGASGWDLLPHRDFWRDVPHLLSDVISHLFTSVRGNTRSSRGGYVSM